MSEMDSYLKAVEMNMKAFDSGLKSLATGMAVGDARQKLNQINTEVKDENERQMMSQQIGQDLALRLSGVGVDPSQATQGLLPNANVKETNKAQAGMQQAGFANDEKRDEAKFGYDKELLKMKLDAMGMKDEKKEKQMYSKFADTFRKDASNKDMIGAWDKMSSLRSILEKTPDRVGVEMAKTGLLKFAGEDRVSDADVIRAQNDPSYRAQVARRLGVEANGKALESDRNFYKMILDHSEGLLKKRLKNKVKGYASGTAELADVDGDKLESGLLKQLMLADEPAAEPPATTIKAKIQSAEQWLKENPNHKDAPAVQQKLEKLRGR